MVTAQRPAWVVACVMTKAKRGGVVEIALRQGTWAGPTKEASIGSAVEEALKSNRGFQLQSTVATEIQLAVPPGGAE